MIIVIGEILIDVFDDYQRIGGAPFNFAFHLKQLGFPVRFVTRIGDDAHGRDILRLLDHHGFKRRDVQIDPHHPTGTVRVTLDAQGIPQFDIRTDVAYDYIDLSVDASQALQRARMVYFGTLAQRTARGWQQVNRFLSGKGPGTVGFCDINLRAPHFHRDAVMGCLQHADFLKLNTEELATIQSMTGGPDRAAHTAFWLMEHFAIQLLVLTRGARGSTLYTEGNAISVAAANSGTLVDTVGAGDAYAAVIAAGMLQGLAVASIGTLAAEFAAHICGLPGAIPEQNAVYNPIRRAMEEKANAP